MGRMEEAKWPRLETWFHRIAQALGVVEPVYWGASPGHPWACDLCTRSQAHGQPGLAPRYTGCPVLGATHRLFSFFSFFINSIVLCLRSF